VARQGQVRFAPGVLDKHFRAEQLTPDQAVRRAIAITDRCEPLQRLLREAAPPRGRPRKIPLGVIARCVMVHSILVPNTQAMTRITDTLWATLNPSQRFMLGLNQVDPTYARVRSSIRALIGLLEAPTHPAAHEDPEIDPRTGEVAEDISDGDPPLVSLDELACALLNAAIPETVPTTGVMAIDGTDVETWADSHGRSNAAIEAGDHGWDPDARFGHRTATTDHPGDAYFGYAAHLATDVPTIGAPPVPHLARGLVLRPANSANAPAGIALLTIMKRAHGLTTCLADRGYTIATADNFAEPAHQLGISIHMDLHTHQHVEHPGPEEGTVWVDGTLYSSALPQRLRKIAAPTLTQTAAEKAAQRDLFDKRCPYRMRATTRPDANGARRFRGPAGDRSRRGTVRCRNVPESMDGPHHIPLTGCIKDEPCGCGITVTVARHTYQRDRQPLPWQSSRWFDSYGRRVGIESLNASIRRHHADINRGYIRVVGLAAVTTLLAFGLAGMNTRILNAWYTSRGVPEPWATVLAEPPDERVPQRQHRRYRSKRGSPPTTPGGHTTKKRRTAHTT
jgi:hypothetical protein